MQIPHKSHTNLFKIDHGPQEQTKSVILKTEEDFTIHSENFFLCQYQLLKCTAEGSHKNLI